MYGKDKVRQQGKVLRQDMLMEGIYSMWIQAEEMTVDRFQDNLFLYIREMAESFCQDPSAFVKLIKKEAHFG